MTDGGAPAPGASGSGSPQPTWGWESMVEPSSHDDSSCQARSGRERLRILIQRRGCCSIARNRAFPCNKERQRSWAVRVALTDSHAFPSGSSFDRPTRCFVCRPGLKATTVSAYPSSTVLRRLRVGRRRVPLHREGVDRRDNSPGVFLFAPLTRPPSQQEQPVRSCPVRPRSASRDSHAALAKSTAKMRHYIMRSV
jgi:hypothetical protein